MVSMEARLQAAQRELKQAEGTTAVLRLAVESAQAMISDVRSVLESSTHELCGQLLQDAVNAERRCQEWQDRNSRIL